MDIWFSFHFVQRLCGPSDLSRWQFAKPGEYVSSTMRVQINTVND